jgi:hypothetical protein
MNSLEVIEKEDNDEREGFEYIYWKYFQQLGWSVLTSRQETFIKKTTSVIIITDQIVKMLLNYLTIFLRRLKSNITYQSNEADLKADVKDIQQEIKKGKKADNEFIARRLRNIKRMAPEILEVVVATIVNPVFGLSVCSKESCEKN